MSTQEDIQSSWQHTQNASMPAIMSGGRSGMTVVLLASSPGEQLNTNDLKSYMELLCHLN